MMIRWKNPEWNKAVAGMRVSCNFIFASLRSLHPSLSLVPSYRFTITTRWMKVDDRCMDWWDAKKNEEKKIYERTNVIVLHFF